MSDITPSGEMIAKALRDAYGRGFSQSGEGYNGEYPGDAHEKQSWRNDRDAWIRQYMARMPVAGPGGGDREEKGACLTAPGCSASQSPSVSALSGEHPSRGWQPIATAPKDGKPILAVWAGYVPVCAHWLPEHERWLTFAPDEFDSKKDLEAHLAATMYKPTHWMPLPEGPALAGEARSAETQSGSVEDEHAAPQGATPDPSPQSSPTLKTGAMTVEEAKEILGGLDPRFPVQQHINFYRGKANDSFSLDSTDTRSRDFDAEADRIETALRTLQGEADHG